MGFAAVFSHANISPHQGFKTHRWQQHCTDVISFFFRISGFSSGPILGHGRRDGQRGVTRTGTVLERSAEKQGGGAQVCIARVCPLSQDDLLPHSPNYTCDIGPVGCVSPRRPPLIRPRLCPQIALSCSGERQSPGESSEGQPRGDGRQRAAGIKHSGRFL